MAAVVERAWRQGATVDAWQNHFRRDAWQEAMAEEGLDPAFYSHRRRPIDGLPGNIDVAVTAASDQRLPDEPAPGDTHLRHHCFAAASCQLKDLRETPPSVGVPAGDECGGRKRGSGR
jgi:hypothetical protein